MDYGFLLLAALVTIVQVDGQDYCKICVNHTMCVYTGTSSTCNQVIKIGVSDADKAVIVDTHNKCRQNVSKGSENRGNPGPQPQAANMKVLIWDNEIANICQRWVQQCMFKHDQCRNTNGTYVGQNLYQFSTSSSSSTPNWPSAVNAWYEEVPKFNRNNINPYQFTPDSGHYTQVAWADTSKVGCSYINYYDGKWYNHYYCCNYSPGGNVIGTPMYQIGAACSSCPGNCNTQYNGLCNK